MRVPSPLPALLLAALAAAPAAALAQSAAHAVAATVDAPAPAAAVAIPLAHDEFIGQLAAELTRHFNLEGELTLELLRPWSPPARVAREWQVQFLEYPAVPASSMLLRCRLLADGVAVADHTLLLRAALWRDAWFAREAIANQRGFDSALLDVRRTDLFREREALPASVGDRSFLFTRSINPGRLLTWRDIARRPLVRKGEVVEVSAADGQLNIVMKALAMQNGAQGEAVTVRNLDSRKDFTAFVVDENRVQVRF